MTKREIDDIAQLCAYYIITENKLDNDTISSFKLNNSLCKLFLLKDKQIIQVFDSLKEYFPSEKAKEEAIRKISSITSFIKNHYYCKTIDDNNKNMKIYDTSWNEYKKILQAYKELAKELNITESLTLSHFIAYLLWNGYFSINKKHQYQIKDRLSIKGFFSLDIFQGSGVCLNYSQLLRDFLNTCDINSVMMCCDLNKYKLNYNPRITRNINITPTETIGINLNEFIMKNILKINIGNHAITLIEGENGLYYYDLTNLAALSIDSPNKASYVAGKGSVTTFPTTSFIIDSSKDANKLYLKLYEDNNQSFKEKEFVDRFKDTVNLLNTNRNLIDDAYNDISNNIKAINKQIKRKNKISPR